MNLPEGTAGVVISGVNLGSAAEATGLQQGDLILEVNRKVIENLNDYKTIRAKVEKEKSVVLLRINRRGNILFVTLNPK